MKKLAPELAIANERGEKTSRIFGIANIAGTQGGERFNAWHKIMYPLLTNGQPGSEEKYLELIYAVRAACASGDFPENATPPIKKHRRQRWPEEDGDADDEDEHTGGGGGGGGATETWSCACGRPCSDVDFDALEHALPCAVALRLEHGKLACSTCHDCARVIFELARDEPTGRCAEVLKLQEFVRKQKIEKGRFDKDAEKRRVRSELAEKCSVSLQAR